MQCAEGVGGSARRPHNPPEIMMIIDCHGHYTSEPPAFIEFRKLQIAAFTDSSNAPAPPQISDDQIREKLEPAQLKFQRERGTDVTIFSPRASAMGHHVGDAKLSAAWTRICNDIIHRIVNLYPKNFIGVCQLPQTPGVPPENCIPELERCVKELGFVGCNLNPDPSGGSWKEPPLTDKWWYPVYEKMVELEVPAMVHVTATCNPAFHTTGSHYINGDTTAFMQFLGARIAATAQERNRPPLTELLLKNVYFDTCVYHQPGIDCMTKVIPSDNILFASEMVGAVKGIDPETGHYFDDTRRYIDGSTILGAADKKKIFETNALKVYPRLAKQIQKQGIAASA